MTTSYDHKTPPVDAQQGVDGEVGIVNDGTYFECDNAYRSVTLTRTVEQPDRISLDIDVDLGAAGQTISVNVDRRALLHALLVLSPIAYVVPGEVVVELETHKRCVVREVHAATATVHDGDGLRRIPVGLLFRAERTMDGDK